MNLLKENRKRTGPSLNQTYSLGIAVAILLFIGSAVRSHSQIFKSAVPPPHKAESTATHDPLDRETPRSAVIGFLKYGARQDYTTAARYLQHPPGQPINLAQFTREMNVLRLRVKINVGLLSDDPNGTVESGLPPDEELVGSFQVGGQNDAGCEDCGGAVAACCFACSA